MHFWEKQHRACVCLYIQTQAKLYMDSRKWRLLSDFSFPWGTFGSRVLKRNSLQDILRSISAAKALQLCPTLCDPIDGSPPGSPVPGILQARTPEWVAISFSNAWGWKEKVKSLSRVWLLVTPWTAAHQAPPSLGFSRQEYWSGVPLPSPISISNNHEKKKSESVSCSVMSDSLWPHRQ